MSRMHRLTLAAPAFERARRPNKNTGASAGLAPKAILSKRSILLEFDALKQ